MTEIIQSFRLHDKLHDKYYLRIYKGKTFSTVSVHQGRFVDRIYHRKFIYKHTIERNQYIKKDVRYFLLTDEDMERMILPRII